MSKTAFSDNTRPVEILIQPFEEEGSVPLEFYDICLDMIQRTEEKASLLDDISVLSLPSETDIVVRGINSDKAYLAHVYTFDPVGRIYQFGFKRELIEGESDNQGLTQFFYEVVADACDVTGAGVFDLIGYHNGSGALPVVGDLLFLDEGGTIPMPDSSIAANNMGEPVGIVILSGQSTAFTCR